MHGEAMDWVTQCRTKFEVRPEDRVLEVGSYNHNGTIRGLFSASNTYVGVDIISGPCVDIVGNINDENFRNTLLETYGGFDIVVSTETLEHTPWQPLMASMLKLLDYTKPVVRLVLTCAGDNRPSHSYDGNQQLKHNEWYANVNQNELRDFVGSTLTALTGETHQSTVVVVSNSGDYDTYLYVEVTRCA